MHVSLAVARRATNVWTNDSESLTHQILHDGIETGHILALRAYTKNNCKFGVLFVAVFEFEPP